MSVARRQLPADPARFAVLKAENAAERARAIVGRQTLPVMCWACGATYSEAFEDDCNDRAARAGLVLVLGEPGTGSAS